MSLPVHTVNIVKGSTQPSNPFEISHGTLVAVANVVGSGAGASVTTAITGLTLPANSNYGVIVTPNQDAVAYVTSKTTTGFSVVLNPRLAANTLAAGTFDVIITH